MSYLSKTERKKQILDTAMTIALDDGLNTLTVRHLAQKASLSVGAYSSSTLKLFKIKV